MGVCNAVLHFADLAGGSRGLLEYRICKHMCVGRFVVRLDDEVKFEK